MVLSCVMIGDEDAEDGLEDDDNIKPDGPVLDVPDIFLHPLLHLIGGLGLSTTTTDLRPTGDAGTNVMAYHVFANQMAIIFGMGEHVRTGTDDTHVATEDIDELGKLVDAGLAEETTETGDAGIMGGGLERVGLIVHTHTAELETGESLSVISCAGLTEKDGAGIGEFRDQSNDGKEDGKDSDEEETGEENVKTTLDNPVVIDFKGLAMEREDLTVTKILDVGAARLDMMDRGNEVDTDDLSVAETE